jgi:hypothetical protein
MRASPASQSDTPVSSSSLFKITTVCLVSCLLSLGCQNPEGTMPAGAAIGAGVGALVGGLAGGGKWAAIGGLAGAGLGLLGGKIVYDKQKDLETRKKVLAASIADTSKVLNQHREYNKHLDLQIQKVKQEIQNIAESEAKGKITPEQAKQARQQLAPGIETMSQEAKQTAQTLQDFTRKAELSEQRAQLLKEIEELKQENDKLAQLLETIAAQRGATAG